MDLPVLITLKDETFDGLYSFFSNPVVVLGFVLAVVAVVLAIMWLASRRHRSERLPQDLRPPSVVEKTQESEELRRLREREDKIRGMEASRKSSKKSTLDDRESSLLERQKSGGGGQKTGGWSVAGGEPALAGESAQAALRASGSKGRASAGAGPLGYGGGGAQGPPVARDTRAPQPEAAKPKKAVPQVSGLGGEKSKLKKMIEIATEKYESGEMNRDAFTRIETDYYKKLIDLEIRMREGDA